MVITQQFSRDRLHLECFFPENLASRKGKLRSGAVQDKGVFEYNLLNSLLFCFAPFFLDLRLSEQKRTDLEVVSPLAEGLGGE